MRASILAILLPLAVLTAACVDPEPNAEGGETGETGGTGDEAPCEPAAPGVASTFSVELGDFPGVSLEGELLGTLDVELDCVVASLSFDAGQLTMTIDCEHPEDPDGVFVLVTTAAEGIPAGVSEGSALSFDVYAAYFESEGGDHSGPWRALTLADSERYALTDEAGVVFVGTSDTLSYAGGESGFSVSSEWSCTDWAPCGEGEGEGNIRGFIRASVGDASIDVQVGEVLTLESGELAWDVSLFNSWLVVDCHNYDYGGFSVVRQPE